jgi:hypothetical protein
VQNLSQNTILQQHHSRTSTMEDDENTSKEMVSARQRSHPPSTASQTLLSSSLSWTPGSIFDILRQNHRKRLYLPPTQWGYLHLELLRCHYTEAPAEISESDNNDVLCDARGDTDAVDVNRLIQAVDSGDRRLAIRSVLHASNLTISRRSLAFRFGQIQPIPIYGFDIFSSAGSSSLVTYTDLEYIDQQLCLNFVRKSGSNDFNRKIRHKKWKSVAARTEAYTLAILITMAQAQAQAQAQARGPRHESNEYFLVSSALPSFVPFLCSKEKKAFEADDSWQPRLIMTTKCKDCLVVFTAHISSSFLHSLSHPFTAPLPPEGPVIRSMVIPYYPCGTFRLRLSQSLGLAHTDGSWSEDSSDSRPLKRLSPQVDNDESTSGDKRQCRLPLNQDDPSPVRQSGPEAG